MTDDLLARAKTALEGTTVGPWSTYGDGTHEVYSTHPGYDDETPDAEPHYRGYVTHTVYRLADAQFIAAGRSLVPELVAEVERLQAVMQRVTELEVAWSIEECTKDSYDRWTALCVALRGES